MEKFKDIISNAGFKADSYDSLDNMNIIDLKSNEVLKKEVYPLEVRFVGSNERRIISKVWNIKIDYNENLLLQEKNTKVDNEYIISSKNNASRIEVVVTKPRKEINVSCVGAIKVKTIDSTGVENNMNIYQLPAQTIISINGQNTEKSIESCNPNIYSIYITNFIEQNGIYADPDIKKGMSIVAPIVNKDIKNIFDHIKNNKVKYVKEIKREKLMLSAEYEAKMNKLDKDIEMINGVFGNQKVKTKNKR